MIDRLIACFKNRHRGHRTPEAADRCRTSRTWWCGQCGAPLRTKAAYDAACAKPRYGPGGTHWLPSDQWVFFMTGKTEAELEQSRRAQTHRDAERRKRSEERSAVREAERIVQFAQGQARPSWRSS